MTTRSPSPPPPPGAPARPRARRALGALAACLLAAPAAAREKTDLVVLENGDRITGEIVGMSQGKLDLKTDDAGRLSVEWLKIARITSAHVYELEFSSGTKSLGPLLPAPADRQVAVGTLVAPLDSVVAIIALDTAFWSRVQAYFDLGFTLAKANHATTLSADGEIAYRSPTIGTSLSFTSYFQRDVNTALTSRNSLLWTGAYFIESWKAVLQAGADQNDELDLKLRLSLTAGAAYAPVRTQFMELWLNAGVAGAREQYTGVSTNGTFGLSLNAAWTAFRYDSPKLDAGVQASAVPLLSDIGRVLGTTSARLKYEVFSDFNVGLTATFTFDTRPPDPTAPKTDYVSSITVGWSYRR